MDSFLKGKKPEFLQENMMDHLQLDFDLVGSQDFHCSQLDPSLNDDFFIDDVFSLNCDLNHDVSNSSLDNLSLSQSSSSFPYQYSPGSGSIDSGVSNSVDLSLPDSPQQLSPNSIDQNYKESCHSKTNPEYNENIFSGNNLLFQKELLDKYIQEQVTQALYQQQIKQMQQQNLNQNMLIMQSKALQEDTMKQAVQLHQVQQQLFMHHKDINYHNQQQQLPQQLQQVSPPPPVVTSVKSESQLIKMLTNKKNNFVNALHLKKDKVQKNNKSPCNKPNKQKQSFSVSAENNVVVEPDSKSALTMLLMQKPQPKHSLTPTFSNHSDIGALSGKHLEKVVPLSTQFTNIDKPADKIPIKRLNPDSPDSAHMLKVKAPAAKKTRVEHVVIEKRYRMKITDSLNELKKLLPCSEESKATKNGILQSSIDELLRLQKENNALKRKNEKLMTLFNELRKVGIIPNTSVSTSSSESNVSVINQIQNKKNETEIIDPEINQDHYASPLLRQSARDGAKFVTCMFMFSFLFISPWKLFYENDHVSIDGTQFSSRHLLNVQEQETSAKYSLVSSLFNIILSLFILMLLLLSGKPKCPKSVKRAQCFRSQLLKAQKKINKHDYEDARGFIRIGLFVIGNSCPKTTYGMLASFTWKCLCHMLYQLGILTILETIGRSLLPVYISGAKEKEHEQFTSRLSAEAYIKLHEIAMKDKSSSYLEVACYIMNAIYAAEGSGDEELLCTTYTTAVIHMREKVRWFSYLLQYYFIGCAHHVSLASKSEHVFAVDWIFESRGYGFFTSSLWNINQPTLLNNVEDNVEVDEANLLQLVYAQFQEFLLTKALKRIVLPVTWYPNEGKIELHQRALSFLEDLGVGPVSEQMDSAYIHLTSFYAWWGSLFKQYLLIKKSGIIDQDELNKQVESFNEIINPEKNQLVTMCKSVFQSFINVTEFQTKKLSSLNIEQEAYKIAAMLENAHKEIVSNIEILPKSDKSTIEELLIIWCSDLIAKATYLLWEVAPVQKSFQELHLLLCNSSFMNSLSKKYPELISTLQRHDFEMHVMSGSCRSTLLRQLKKSQQLFSVSRKIDINNASYLSSNNIFPLKQDGFLS
ncbi:uncharacterized protein LOC100200726 [Hydra vulgaris]|uniref:uncharacterized protein LOC100200726 n=1 Tax=Hydra vulgaris TaxID=6087 RepID=UPI001F5E6439|nr:uncharacterized protein LOC100200726 isoform X1 [Hydra vulgaris]